jgi:hypothetical protein
MSENTRKKGTDHPKAAGVYVTIAVFERFWVVSPFFTPVLFFIIYPARQLHKINISASFRFFLSDGNRKEKDRNPQVKGRRMYNAMDSGLFRAGSYH